MPIDFHDPANRHTYTGRRADSSWTTAMREIIDPAGLQVVDIGCGGGTYSRAWRDLGAAEVTGVDFSAEMLIAAREAAVGEQRMRFAHGDAAATGLPTAGADIVFERALVHHVADLDAVAQEAHRLLRHGGTYVVQDRTLQDVALAGSERHPRGFLFELFPRLLDEESDRRPTSERLTGALTAAGFVDIAATQLWEVRRVHPTPASLLDELATRTGRSILHHLSDDELAAFVDYVGERLPADREVVETDRWTLWTARR